MRAYRPSLLGEDDGANAVEPEDEYRQERLRAYGRRAREGLPLFEPAASAFGRRQREGRLRGQRRR